MQTNFVMLQKKKKNVIIQREQDHQLNVQRVS